MLQPFLHACERRLAVSGRAAALFRIAVGSVVLLDLYSRFLVLEWFYADTGAFPRWAIMPEPSEEPAVWALCVHAWLGSLGWQHALVALHAACAVCFTFGAWPRASGCACLWLHLSLTLRNPTVVYILDRYIHLLLFFAVLLPVRQLASGGGADAQAQAHAQAQALSDVHAPVASAASLALALQDSSTAPQLIRT